MSLPRLPDFEHTLALAQGNLDAAGLAECHGVVCGLLVRRPDSAPDAFFLLLTMLEILAEPGLALEESLQELHHASVCQLADKDMRFVIWLPHDEDPLEERTRALAQWCNGFLAGFGSGQDGRLDTLSEEADESLADLQQIALAEVADEAGAGEEEREEEEMAFMEIVEYIRIAVLILAEDLRGPVASDSIH